MKFELRDYQKSASDRAVEFFNSKKKRGNAIMVLPTGAGKSLLIADIASRLSEPTLVFQPSKEILEQNYKKMMSYGVLDCSIYSASMNRKNILRITFATIGSVINHKEKFKHFKNIIIDEAHLVNSKQGMYFEFLEQMNVPVLGLTATPYRLSSTSFGAILKFITRTRPRVFKDVIYYCQVGELAQRGYLAKLEYYPVRSIVSQNLQLNSTRADYTDKSVKAEYKRAGFENKVLNVIERLIKAGRENILVFTRFVEEAEFLVEKLDGLAEIVTAQTPKKEREKILKEFKSGEIRVVANVGILTCLSEDTEILTRNKGWVGMNQISKEDLVAQFDDGEITFSEPEKIIVNDNYCEDFVSLEGRYMNFLVTHNHKMLYGKRKRGENKCGKLRKCNARDLVEKKVYIPVSGNASPEVICVEQEKKCSDSRFLATNSYNYRKKGASYEESYRLASQHLNIRNALKFKNPSELTIEECKFIGFWLGDGSAWKQKTGGFRYSLCQSHRTFEICEWIENIMQQIGIKYSFKDYSGKASFVVSSICNTYPYRVYSLSIGTGGHKQHVDSFLYPLLPYLKKKGTDLFWGLNKNQYLSLMEGLFKADGNHGNSIKYTGQKIVGEHKELFDLLQAIGVCRGFRVSISLLKKTPYNKKQLYNISLCDKQRHELVNDRAVLIHNDSPKTVWCVTMPKGNIITRRNGRVTIMGNCGFDYPELSTIVLARPTMSLALYYQMVGRGIRPHSSKQCTWIVDMCENYNRFGKVEDIILTKDDKGLWCVSANGKQLTNIFF